METRPASTINLLLVDDHAMFRQGLARVLEKEPGFKIVGQYASGSEALGLYGPRRFRFWGAARNSRCV